MADPTIPVLIGVDDDFRSRECIKSIFESAGFTSFLFPSAEECLRSGVLATASCLVTDVRMPGVDGIELQRRVRLELPELPVILISGHHDDEIQRKALQNGAFDFIYKPFDGRVLLAAVNRAISK